MKNIFEMSVMDFMIKSGNINVDAGELKHLLYLIERYNTWVSSGSVNNFIDENFINSFNSFIEFFNNKYIILGDLRLKEKSAFDFMQTIEKGMKILSGEDYKKANELYIEQCNEYAEYKRQRVELQRSLEKIKEEKYSWIV